MFGLFRKKAGSGNFWEWLAANTVRIQANLARNPQGISDEIGKVFERSYPGLTWEIGLSKESPWLFCISADGNGDLFPQVLQAVNAAPVLPDWKIQAFRSRGPLTAVITMGDQKLGYEDVWCGVKPQDGGVHVTLYIRGWTPVLDRVVSPAAVMLLDHAVGEYDAVMMIKELDREALPTNPQQTANFFPLSELPPFLDRIQNR